MFSKTEHLRRLTLDPRAVPHTAAPAFSGMPSASTLCPLGEEDPSQLAEPAETLLVVCAQLEAELSSFNNASECAVSLEK